jgi:hypothetical protein
MRYNSLMNVLKLEHFETAGLHAEEIYPGIFTVHEFLTEDEVSKLELQFSTMNEEDWRVSYTESLYRFIEDQYGVTTFEEAQALGHRIDIDGEWVDKNAMIQDLDVRQTINERLASIFVQFPELELRGAGSIQRQYEGVRLNYHVDSESNPLVVYAAVMYVNGDFEGGELHFPRIDVKIKPAARDLIIFPSADDYLHGVLPVEAGPTRYALPAFINKRTTEENTDDA